MPPSALPVVSQPVPRFVTPRTRFGEIVASSGPRGSGVAKAAATVADNDKIIDTTVPNVAFIAERSSGAESAVNTDVRPLVHRGTAKERVVALSLVQADEVPPSVAEVENVESSR